MTPYRRLGWGGAPPTPALHPPSSLLPHHPSYCSLYCLWAPSLPETVLSTPHLSTKELTGKAGGGGCLVEGSGVRMKGGGRISSWNEAELKPGEVDTVWNGSLEKPGRLTSGLSLPCSLREERTL